MKFRFLKNLRFVVPGLLIAVMVLQGLSGYTAPVYAVPQREMTGEETGQETVSAAALQETAGPENGSDGSGEQAKAQESALQTEADVPEDTKENIQGDFDLADGSYEGEAKGYGGLIRVRVDVKDGSITDIQILSARDETPAFLNRAKKVIQDILDAQDTDVDTVSEATYSSRGIIRAVKNALQMDDDQEEEEDEDDPDTGGSSASGKKSAPRVRKTSDPKSYKDGTYTGSADGFGGKIKVKVTVKKGKIKRSASCLHPEKGRNT